MSDEEVRAYRIAFGHRCWYCAESAIWWGKIDRSQGLRDGDEMTALCRYHHQSIVLGEGQSIMNCSWCRNFGIQSRQTGKTQVQYNSHVDHMRDVHRISLPHWEMIMGSEDE